jgi:hypothetical protein
MDLSIHFPNNIFGPKFLLYHNFYLPYWRVPFSDRIKFHQRYIGGRVHFFAQRVKVDCKRRRGGGDFFPFASAGIRLPLAAE